MRHVLILPVMAAALVACGESDPDLLVIDYGDNGSFMGEAGSGWSEEDLRNNGFGALCGPDGAVKTLSYSPRRNGSAEFSGTCE